jgi:hypothetical protein
MEMIADRPLLWMVRVAIGATWLAWPLLAPLFRSRWNG